MGAISKNGTIAYNLVITFHHFFFIVYSLQRTNKFNKYLKKLVDTSFIGETK